MQTVFFWRILQYCRNPSGGLGGEASGRPDSRRAVARQETAESCGTATAGFLVGPRSGGNEMDGGGF